MVSRQTKSKIEALLKSAGPIITRQEPVVMPDRVRLALQNAFMAKFGGKAGK